MIDQSSEPIASRNFGVLVLNNEFWQSVGDAFFEQTDQRRRLLCRFQRRDAALLKSLREHVPLPACTRAPARSAGGFGYNVDTALVIQMRAETV